MAERYSRFYSMPENLYTDGSPVIISAGALSQDNQSGKVFVQLKFKKINSCSIRSLKVEIVLLDSAGRALGAPMVQPYIDLENAENTFGSKTPIYVTDTTARSFNVKVIEVVLGDGTIWSGNGGEWVSLGALESIEFEGEMLKQFKIDYNEQTNNKFLEKNGVWFCTCGTANTSGNTECSFCKASYSKLSSLDKQLLKENCDARVEAENAAKAQKKKKLSIILASAISVFLIVATLTGIFVIKPIVGANNVINVIRNQELNGNSLGYVFTMGKYKGEKLQWVVIDVDPDGYCLAVACDSIGEFQFDSNGSTEWQNSTLDKFLNEKFYNKAFNFAEKKKLMEHSDWGDRYGGKISLIEYDDVMYHGKFLSKYVYSSWMVPFNVVSGKIPVKTSVGYDYSKPEGLKPVFPVIRLKVLSWEDLEDIYGGW